MCNDSNYICAIMRNELLTLAVLCAVTYVFSTECRQFSKEVKGNPKNSIVGGILSQVTDVSGFVVNGQ